MREERRIGATSGPGRFHHILWCVRDSREVRGQPNKKSPSAGRTGARDSLLLSALLCCCDSETRLPHPKEFTYYLTLLVN